MLTTIWEPPTKCKFFIGWSYKEGFGSSIDPRMLFNLEELIQPQDLFDLEAQFTMEEIDQVIKKFPTNRAPGLDGFNGIFLNVGILLNKISIP